MCRFPNPAGGGPRGSLRAGGAARALQPDDGASAGRTDGRGNAGAFEVDLFTHIRVRIKKFIFLSKIFIDL